MAKSLWIAAGFALAAAWGFCSRDIAVAQERSQELWQVRPAKKLSDIPARPGFPRLTGISNGHVIHAFRTVQGARALAAAAADQGPLYYHGGPIMPSATFYAIYWIPASGTLQNGQPTALPAAYQNLQTQLLSDYGGHALANITTQYYQIAGSTFTWSSSADSLGGVAVDNSPYPASGCSDSATPGNCITDVQIQAEIQKVMTANGWTGGLNKIFLLYTSSGEGSCFDSTGASCAYTAYCAYHGYFGGSPNVIYANIPYGNLNVCAAGQPSPNNAPLADSVTSSVSHEITEAITDPLLNAWFTDQGDEIGDLCAYQYATNTWPVWPPGTPYNANQRWNGHSYELQMEFDNHSYGTLGCRLVGPS